METMKQMTLSAGGFDQYGKTTRRAAFLAGMDRVVPWSVLCALIEPVYPKAGNRLFVVAALANLFMARRHLLGLQEARCVH